MKKSDNSVVVDCDDVVAIAVVVVALQRIIGGRWRRHWDGGCGCDCGAERGR